MLGRLQKKCLAHNGCLYVVSVQHRVRKPPTNNNVSPQNYFWGNCWSVILLLLTELHMFFMTRSTKFFSSTVFIISRQVLGNPLKVYFEGAKKQACNYAENALYYRCFSRNLARIYRTAILSNLFWCMQSKSQWSTHLVAFFNPLIMVVTKKHTGSLSSMFL